MRPHSHKPLATTSTGTCNQPFLIVSYLKGIRGSHPNAQNGMRNSHSASGIVCFLLLVGTATRSDAQQLTPLQLYEARARSLELAQQGQPDSALAVLRRITRGVQLHQVCAGWAAGDAEQSILTCDDRITHH